jgi:hypothetical protein
VTGGGISVVVNVFIPASECDQDSRLASQTIFRTTALTLAAWLALLR